MAEEEETRVAEATRAAGPALPAYGHAPLKGAFPLRLDTNGRIALPAALKGPFTGEAVLRPHRQKYLNLYTPLAFEEVVKAYVAGQPEGVLDPRTRKRLYMSTTEVAVDRQSRLVVPPELRARVGLGERIVLAGAIEAVEIWPAETFADEEATFDDADLFFDGFAGL
jgi:MraZ protein